MNVEQRHPEDLIYDTKQFIQNLTRVQNQEFDILVEKMGLTKLGEEFLFDFVFNDSDQVTFDEYLEKYGRTFSEFK